MTQSPAGPPYPAAPSPYPAPPGSPGISATAQQWPPPPPTYPAYAVKHPRPAPAVWGILASGAVIVVVLAHFHEIWRLSQQIALVDNLRAGAPVSLAEATSADHAASVASVLYVVTGVIAAVLVMVWAYQARTNATAYAASEFRRSRGWAVGGWVCPIVNLWFPYQAVKDIWTASDTSRPSGFQIKAWEATALLPAWWTCFIAARVIDRISASLYSAGVDATAPGAATSSSNGQLHASLIFDYMSTGFDIAAAIMFIVIVATISRFQTQRFQWFTEGAWPR